MVTRTREKQTTTDDPQPILSSHNGSDLGGEIAVAYDSSPESQPHPLASVLGSFRDDNPNA